MRISPIIRIVAATWLALLVGQVQALTTGRANPEFENRFSMNHGDGTVHPVSPHVGSVGAYAPPASPNASSVIPFNNLLRLRECAFGQSLAANLPEPDYIGRTLLEAQQILYPPTPSSRSQVQASTNAFRYRLLVYQADANNISRTAATFRAEYFTVADRANADRAIEMLRRAIGVAPYDRTLRHAYLDAFYDRTLAELLSTRLEIVDLATATMGLSAINTNLAPGEMVIDGEVRAHEKILQSLRVQMTNYFSLLGDFMGLDSRRIFTGLTNNVPMGYQIFREEQPRRGQSAAVYLDDNGNERTVPDQQNSTAPRLLEEGAYFKDLVLVLALLKDFGMSAGDLNRLYALRKKPGDVAKARAVAGEVERKLIQTLSVYVGMFPATAFSGQDPAGVRTAVRGVENAIQEASSSAEVASGALNPLGFAPDFLFIIPDGENPGNPQSTYDVIMRTIVRDDTSAFKRAKLLQEQAIVAYRQFRGFSDQVAVETDGIEQAYSDRFFEITGFRPDEIPGFQGVSTSNGLLWQASENQKLLILRGKSLTNILNSLDVQYTNALKGVEAALKRPRDIDEAYRTYERTAGSAWDTIAIWESTRATAQATFELVAATTSALGIDDTFNFGVAAAINAGAGAANAATQGAAAYEIANKQKRIDLAAARFDAELAKIDADLLLVQARQELGGIVRERFSVALDLEEVTTQIVQSQNEISAYHREIEHLISQRDSNLGDLSERYHADPIHYIRSQSRMLRADFAFRNAQRWIFFAQQALQYKWRSPFEIFFEGRQWSNQDIFRVRNLEELEDLKSALEEFDGRKRGKLAERTVDRISLRDHLLTPLPSGFIDSGMRIEPGTTNMISKAALFRKYLLGQATSPAVQSGVNFIEVRINTASLGKRGGFLYSGPEYDERGCRRTTGTFNDKIVWVKLKAVTSQASPPVPVLLSYGGTCFIRSEFPPGCIDSNTGAPVDGVQAFPFQFFSVGMNVNHFQGSSLLSATIPLYLGALSGEPNAKEEGSRFLAEQSVAASDVRLTFKKSDLDLERLEDIEIWIQHAYLRTSDFSVCAQCN